jgi:hypothetical protein
MIGPALVNHPKRKTPATDPGSWTSTFGVQLKAGAIPATQVKKERARPTRPAKTLRSRCLTVWMYIGNRLACCRCGHEAVQMNGSRRNRAGGSAEREKDRLRGLALVTGPVHQVSEVYGQAAGLIVSVTTLASDRGNDARNAEPIGEALLSPWRSEGSGRGVQGYPLTRIKANRCSL